MLNMLGALDNPYSGEIIIDGINLGNEKDLSDFRRDDILKNMHEEYNVTLIIVTHDNDVAKLAERTITIKDGQIIEDKYN